MFDGVKEDHSLELANLLRSGQFPSFDSAQRGFRSLPERSIPPPLPSTDPPPPHSINGRNSRLAFLDNLSASDDSQEHSADSSHHSSETASLASHGDNKDALPVLLNLGLVNQGFKPDEDDPNEEKLKDVKDSLKTESEDIQNPNFENGDLKVS